MNSKQYALGTIAVLISATMWGFSSLFSRQLFSLEFEPFQAALLRISVGLILLLVFILIKNPGALKLKSPKHLGYFFMTGTIGLALSCGAYFVAISMIDIAVAVVIMYSTPVLVYTLAYFIFGEKITGRKMISMILAIGGCVIMSGILSGSGVVSVLGIIAAILAAVGYAFYIIGGKMASNNGYGAMTITVYTFAFAVLGLLPFVLNTGMVSHIVATPASWPLIIGIGVVCSLVPYGLYYWGLERVEAGKASIFSFMEPVTATIIGLTVYSEKLTFSTIAAIILIFLSIVVVADLSFKRKKLNGEENESLVGTAREKVKVEEVEAEAEADAKAGEIYA